MNVEYRVKEWHTGSVYAGETGALGLQAMLNEPELLATAFTRCWVVSTSRC